MDAPGVDPGQGRLPVTDSSMVLLIAGDAVRASQYPVQRRKTHKLRNVIYHLPKHQGTD